MDLGDKDKFGLEKRGVEMLNYHSPNVPLDWRFRDSNLASQPLGLVPSDNSIPISKGDLMVSPMGVDSFCPTLWDHSNAESLSFIDNNVHHASTSTSNTAVIRKGIPVTSRAGIESALDMGWNSPNMMMRGGAFLQNNARNLPPSLSQFPADSGFIERAARFSCFSGGNFGDIVNPFNISESLNPYSKGGVPLQGSQEVLSANGMNSPLGAESQKNELNMAEISRDRSVSIEHGLTGGSPNKNDMEKRSYTRPSDEGRHGIGMASNESGEAEFSGGGGGQGEQSMVENDGGDPASSKGLGTKKRKRPGQNTEIDQEKGTSQHSGDAAKGDDKTKEKVDQNNTSASNKAAGKHGKDGSQASDAPKEDYIHIRARRGQATNSHSLAERVRREKISERMKFLQELVPGCSKVTGKAVMLDEIINYVQSLQRQVEFLSMKLATVNPRLDFNIEGILGKDILQSRGGPSTLGFSPDMSMVHPHLHPSQQGMISGGIPGLGNSSDALRRTISSQLAALNSGYKDLMPQNHQQIPSGWDDELHNVVQMGFDNNGPFSNQDLNGSLPPGHMKVEL